MKTILLVTLAVEAVLMGYAIGKYDLDETAKAALKRRATAAIAYAKAVPPAPTIDLKRIS